jgi:hypothetical protein
MATLTDTNKMISPVDLEAHDFQTATQLLDFFMHFLGPKGYNAKLGSQVESSKSNGLSSFSTLKVLCFFG